MKIVSTAPFITVKFITAYRGFKPGDTFEFLPGLNILVGDQGSGKSTLLNVISNARFQKQVEVVLPPNVPVVTHDFERDNVRTAAAFRGGKSEVSQLFMSHGQAMAYSLRDIATELKKPSIVLLDEPDIGMSVRTAKALSVFLNAMVRAGHTLIVSIHNPIVYMNEPVVLDMEVREWTTGDQAMARMLADL